jgi:predicted lysophospholipase L1 biosynthesis ABC-type transport system permease subunit
VLVNQTFVERYLGSGRDPLGTTLAMGDDEAPIVGVLHDVVERSVDHAPEPAVYLPIDRATVRTRTLVVRTEGEPGAILEDVQAAVWAVDADVPVYEAETMEALVERRVGGFAVIGNLMGVFALLSLALGAVGIYGVTAYAAGQRTTEIGVRMAVGARRADVVRMVLGQGARRAGLGLALGLALALALSGALEGVLVGVSPRDPATFGIVAIVLGAVSFLGIWLPARRAARTDPVRALAAE